MPSCPYMNPKPTFTHLAYPFYHVQTDLEAGYGIKRSVNIVWGALELRVGD